MLTGSVVPEVLKMANEHQQGRGTSIVPSGTLFNFTEGWFRDSGLYELNSEYQARFIEGIVPDILKITLEHQQGRGTTNVPSGTTFIKWYIYYIFLHTHL
ncbi:MAG: hypothetical protein WAU62_00700 [Dehalococcoidales bacterium]